MSKGNERGSAAKAAVGDSGEQAGAGTGIALDENTVRDYLRVNGDFLQRHPELLDHLHIGHAAGSAVSLVERQVSVLRERNIDMRHRLKALTANARENDRLFEHTGAMVLRLLEARTVPELCTAYFDSMRSEFGVEYASLILFGEEPHEGPPRIESRERAENAIGSLLRGSKGMCGTLRGAEFDYLFGRDSDAADTAARGGEAGSAAVMPLTGDTELGLIAVGSDDPHRYTTGTGTLFLSHIANVIARLLPRLGDSGD